MTDNNFDIDDIQLTRRSAAPQKKTQDTEENTATREFTFSAPRIEIIVDEEADEKPFVTPVMPQNTPPEMCDSAEIAATLDVPEIKLAAKPAPQPEQKEKTKAKTKPFSRKAAPPPEQMDKKPDTFTPAAIPNVTAPTVKKRNYALGCCIFSFIIPLFIGAGAAATVRYWKTIRIQMERFDAWMAKHGLSYDGEDAPWKHKKENKAAPETTHTN